MYSGHGQHAALAALYWENSGNGYARTGNTRKHHAVNHTENDAEIFFT